MMVDGEALRLADDATRPAWRASRLKAGKESGNDMYAFGDKEWPGLAKLNEECGETVQVIGKLMMTHGGRPHWDGSDLRERFCDEVADVLAAAQFVAKHVLMPAERDLLDRRVREKLALFEMWHAGRAAP